MTSTPTSPAPSGPAPDLLERRRAAIEVSGWGERFHLLQPRNACFWVYLLFIGLGAYQLINLVAPTAGIFAEANATAFATSGAFGLVFLYFLHRFDRWERTPGWLAVTAFAGGAIAAPWAMALSGNGALFGLYAKIFGQAWTTDWQAGLSAPFVEETAKASVFVLMMGLAPVVIRTVYDGLIVGAYVGLGFQVLEDMLYGQNSAAASFGTNQAGNVIETFFLRAATGVASHAAYTAVFCAGIVLVLGTKAQPRRLGGGIALIIAPMIVHGLWDSMGALAAQQKVVTFLLLIGITALMLVVLMIAIRRGSFRERAFMRDILAPEVASGTLTELELEAVAGERKRRRADRKTARKHDQVSRRKIKRIIAAAHDLATDLAESHGEETADVEHSRAEIRRLRGLPA